MNEKKPTIKMALPPIVVPKIDDKGAIIIPEEHKDTPLLALIGKDGYYLRIKSAIHESITKLPVENFNLPELKPIVRTDLPKLPLEMLRQAHSFLRASYKKNKAETVVLYYFNAEQQEYKAIVPDQVVSAASIKYEIPADEAMKLQEDGWMLVGTIHSHPGFSAFQSGVDKDDEFEIDGWHITLGNVENDPPNYHVRYCAANTNFAMELADIVAIPTLETVIYPDNWMEKVRVVQTEKKGGFRSLGANGWNGTGQSVYGGNTNLTRETHASLYLISGNKIKEHKCIIVSQW